MSAESSLQVVLLGDYAVFREQLQEAVTRKLLPVEWQHILADMAVYESAAFMLADGAGEAETTASWHERKWDLSLFDQIMEGGGVQRGREIGTRKRGHFWRGMVFIHTTLQEQAGREVRTADLHPEQAGAISRDALYMLVPLTAYCQEQGHKLCVLTAPVDKYHLAQAGYPFCGQSEFFEFIWKQEALMVLWAERLRVGLITRHVPLSEVSDALSADKVVAKIRLFYQCLRSFQLYAVGPVRIALCGVNPHASDQGLIGTEEQELLQPALHDLREEMVREGYEVELQSADSAFYSACHGYNDGVLAVYHDQGLGPLKALHFDTAVNMTWGLRYLRVSPDHGPARDLYMTSRMSCESFWQAFERCMAYLRVQSALNDMQDMTPHKGKEGTGRQG